MIKRTIHSKIIESLKGFPVIVLTGARQVGKSTEVYSFVKTHGFSIFRWMTSMNVN